MEKPDNEIEFTPEEVEQLLAALDLFKRSDCRTLAVIGIDEDRKNVIFHLHPDDRELFEDTVKRAYNDIVKNGIQELKDSATPKDYFNNRRLKRKRNGKN